MVQTSIIIPCYWSTPELITMTERCLESLRFGQPDQVVVVDDGSPLVFNPHVAIRREVNGGYAAAVNTGLEAAEGDILIISNNDIIFMPGWLEAIVQPLQNGYDISSIRTSDQGDWSTEDKLTENDNFGSIWAMTRKVYETLGGLDERFGKGYFEDQDYKQRALEAGFKIAKNHAGLVEHLGRQTFKQVDPDNALFIKNLEVYRQKWGRVD